MTKEPIVNDKELAKCENLFSGSIDLMDENQRKVDRVLADTVNNSANPEDLVTSLREKLPPNVLIGKHVQEK